MKHLTFTTIFILVLSSNLFGQSKRPIFIGIQPAITVEPFYEEGELDVNCFPLVIETRIGNRTNLRFAPIANYHIGGSENGFSDIGLFAVLPIFFKKAESLEDRTRGFYIGPVLGFGRNLINEHYTTTLAVEPGYMLKADKRFTAAFGLQLGSSYFSDDAQPSKWVFHWGPKISLGFWLN
jgi:hypothetical protein